MQESQNTLKPIQEMDELLNSLPELVIRPSRGWVSLNLADLWRYRELIFFLTWRDINVRYKQTVLGAAWAIIQPFFTMLVFSIFFGELGQNPFRRPALPDLHLLRAAALAALRLFADRIGQQPGGQPEPDHQGLFPAGGHPALGHPGRAAGFRDRLRRPAGDDGVLRHPPDCRASGPCRFFVLLALVTALGAGLWLSALNVEYRDVRYTIPFLTQFWMFLTPIAYPSSMVPEQWRALYGLNPMVGVVEGFRWALLGTGTPAGPDAGRFGAGGAGCCWSAGCIYFRRMERTFADEV